MNLGFSSTSGVQIAMSRFADVTYDPTTQTATIGAGLIWDDVYAALEPHGVNVAGGRVSGIGVAGYTLGGGKLVGSCILRLESRRSHGRNAVTRLLLAHEPIWFKYRHSGCIRAGIAKRYRHKCHRFPGGSILCVEGMLSCASGFFHRALTNLSTGWIQQLRKYTYIW